MGYKNDRTKGGLEMAGGAQYHNEQRTFTVSHWKALSNHMANHHFHSTYEIFYLMSGEREFFIQDRTISISEGDIVIIAPNTLHRTTNAKMPKYERLVLSIHESCMTGVNGVYTDVLQPLFEREYILIRHSQYDQASVQAIAQRIIREVQDRKPGFEIYALTLALQLLITCCRYMIRSGPEQPDFPSPMHARISEIVHYMNSHYMEDLSLHYLAERFYVSPYYLSRSFKEVTGFTFVEYLNHVRIKEAKKLLMRSTMKVNLVSKKVGFGSVTHFGRVFKQITGHPPLYYRKTQ